MYLFVRGARLGLGHAQEETAWAMAITEKVNQISETRVSLWTTFLSPGVNTLYWTTAAEDLATFEATEDKLMTDSGYLMLLEQGARYVSADPINDELLQVVHAGAVDVATPPAYIAEVCATLAPGQGARGIEVGVQIAEKATQLAKAPTSFAIAATGSYGAVAWHTPYESITELQRGESAVMTDPEFMQLLDTQAKEVFQPHATQAIYRRLM